ncbi:hypothetical protein N8549_00945, partial [bacterium]|nr:hypothetical protein [bacterium]
SFQIDGKNPRLMRKVMGTGKNIPWQRFWNALATLPWLSYGAKPFHFTLTLAAPTKLVISPSKTGNLIPTSFATLQNSQ